MTTPTQAPALVLDLTQLRDGDQVHLVSADHFAGGSEGHVLALVAKQRQEWSRPEPRREANQYGGTTEVDGPELAQLATMTELFWVVVRTRDEVMTRQEELSENRREQIAALEKEKEELQYQLGKQQKAVKVAEEASEQLRKNFREEAEALKQCRGSLRKYEADLGKLREHFGTKAIADALYPKETKSGG